ncbi:selenocysteine-specific translation elongation factor [Nitrospirillum sp. BR 11164]|uniref:selenocysteine-specific translation elongation factor n=1 Tax=Nitrospirillum sp. BR 11164 TaxID=3104324 RepID=UPI002AFE73D6|nr:selenocysteine-specific translation elongation factor [Nitrospirillum sp. BR 11164]MEA1652169.1 selenocysteine-specific translation elongation factor [Nitrospirillum sp. BR 11164]
MIIGTAGHIDHGKTALVRALTGVDGDRLKEEKARGITIDLGFAYLPLPDGPTLGFVDVPGHERFVHTMVAGASGIDYALLVVAADDGVMPQTREHLAIIDLLGIRHGLVALTKADLAPPDRLAAVTAEISAALAGTSLDGADILPVSALTGAGIDTLRQRLEREARAQAATKTAADPGAFRLAIDRAFTLTGVGVVVTGTVLSGRVRVGDGVTVSPSGLPARVRSLHAQNAVAEEGRAGDRCALNLAGPDITKEALHRGDMVLAPALHAPTDRIDASLRLLPRDAGAKPLAQWFPVRLHHAAAEVGARVVLLSEETLSGGEATQVQLVLERPIAAAAGDRYVIRDVSAQHTLGGGRFLDLRPPPRRRRTAERAAQRAALALPSPEAALAALLAIPPHHADLTAFVRDHALPDGTAAALADALNLVVLDQGGTRTALSADRWAAFLAHLSETLAAYHAENPDLQGMGREKLRLAVQPRLPVPIFAVAIGRAVAEGLVALDGAFIRLSGHVVRLAPADEAAWADFAPLLGGEVRFRPPRVRDIAADTGRDEGEVRRILKLAGRMGWADQVAHDHFFLRDTVREMMAIAVDVAAQSPGGAFVVAPFRDRMDNGRKVAIQILDFFDRHGVTLRRGDLRRVNPHRLDLFGPPVVL